MKQPRLFRGLWAVGLLLALSVGCSRTDTDSGVTPDEACRVQTKTSAGATIAYAYDGAGRLATQSYSSVSGTTV